MMMMTAGGHGRDRDDHSVIVRSSRRTRVGSTIIWSHPRQDQSADAGHLPGLRVQHQTPLVLVQVQGRPQYVPEHDHDHPHHQCLYHYHVK